MILPSWLCDCGRRTGCDSLDSVLAAIGLSSSGPFSRTRPRVAAPAPPEPCTPRPYTGPNLPCQKAKRTGGPRPLTSGRTLTMAHELDQIAGHVSYADSRRDAWHQLGQQVGHAMTAREALRAAHLAAGTSASRRWSLPRSRSSPRPASRPRHRCRCPTVGDCTHQPDQRAARRPRRRRAPRQDEVAGDHRGR